MTRREALKGLALFAAPVKLTASEEREYTLQNANLSFQITLRNARVLAMRLWNKLADEAVDLPAENFAVEFDKGFLLTPSAMSLAGVTPTEDRIELLYSRASGETKVRVEYRLPRGRHYFRKQIALESSEANPPRVMRANLENWKGVRREWQSMRRADSQPYGSRPIFCETLWAGVEFVAAFNEYGRNGFILRSRPGGKLLGKEWLPLHSTVVAVAEPGKTRASFFDYIEDIRLTRPRWMACYNTWWSLPPIFQQDEYLNLIRKLKEKLYDQHRIFFDLVCTDVGWSDPRSIWRVNLENLAGRLLAAPPPRGGGVSSSSFGLPLCLPSVTLLPVPPGNLGFGVLPLFPINSCS
jgi:hypothetical protein